MKALSLSLFLLLVLVLSGCGKEIQNSDVGNNFKASHNTHKAYNPTENLKKAVEKQSRVLVIQAIAEKADLNHIDKDGKHVLNIAIETGNFEIVRKLIEAGADINAQNNNNEYALVIAIRNDQQEIAKYLIQNGARLNYPNQKSPLLYALAAQMPELAALMLQENIDLEWDERFGPSASELAKRYHYENLLTLIETSIALKNNVVNSELVLQILRNGETDSLEFLYKHYKNSLKELADSNNFIGESILHEDEKLRVKMIKTLLTSGLSPDGELNDQVVPLVLATQRQDLAVSKLLVEAGADVNKTNTIGRSPLLYAAKKLLVEHIELFLENGAKLQYTARVNENLYFFKVCRFIPNKRYFLRREFQNLSSEEILNLYKTTKELLDCK